jgi:hypothetical protein
MTNTKSSATAALVATGIFAILLPISFFLDWYKPTGFAAAFGGKNVNAWDAFSGLAPLAAVCAVVGIVAAGLGIWFLRRGMWREASYGALAAAAVGALTALLLIRRIIDPPLGKSAEEALVGAYIGFGIAILMAISAALAAALTWRRTAPVPES